MTGFAKPAWARYGTEILPEVTCQNGVVAGSVIGSYSSIGKRLLEIRNLTSSRPVAFPIETVVSTDVRGEALKVYSAAQPNARIQINLANKVRSKDTTSIRQRTIGGAEANVITTWHVVVRPWNLLDMYRWGIKPEEAISMINPTMSDADKTRILAATTIGEKSIPDVVLREQLGTLPRHRDLLDPSVGQLFDDVLEVSRSIPALAANGGQQYLSGGEIPIPPGYIGVILSVAVDAAQVFANLSVGAANPYNACFIYISRDDLTDYVRMDTTAMPSTAGAGTPDFEMRMYIPVASKFSVRIINNHTVNAVVANLPLRVTYGIRKIGIREHEMWGIPYTSGEQATAEAMITSSGLRDKIIIGEE